MASTRGAALLQGAQFLGACYCVNTLAFEFTQCEGPSMLPTLNKRGDLLLVNKVSMALTPLRRQDLVVAKSPTRNNQYVCKRVLAVVSHVRGVTASHCIDSCIDCGGQG